MSAFKDEKGKSLMTIPHRNIRIVLHEKTQPALRHIMFGAFVKDSKPHEIVKMQTIVENVRVK